MLTKLSMLSITLLLAGGVGFAAAQSSTAPATGATSATKCFDRASNQVKDKSAMNNPDTKMNSAGTKSGSAPASSMSGPSANVGPSGTTGSGNAGRPAIAANLPDC
jgi:hypothetical protein